MPGCECLCETSGTVFDSEAKVSGPDLRLWKLQDEFWGGKKLMSFPSMGHLVLTLDSKIFPLVMVPVIRQLWMFKTSFSNSYTIFQVRFVQLMTSPAPKTYFLHRISTCSMAKKRVFWNATCKKAIWVVGESHSVCKPQSVIFLTPSNNQPTKLTLLRNAFEIFHSPGIKITFTLLFLVEQLFLKLRCVLD